MMTKIDEMMKAHGKRELSMDELVKVSGGACYYIRAGGMANGMMKLLYWNWDAT